MRRGLRDDEFTGGCFGPIGRHQRIDQPHLQCLVAADVLAGEHHVHRGQRAAALDGTHGAAVTGMNAELDFGQADFCRRVIRRHDVITGQ